MTLHLIMISGLLADEQLHKFLTFRGTCRWVVSVNLKSRCSRERVYVGGGA